MVQLPFGMAVLSGLFEKSLSLPQCRKDY